jgi:hypothetical protein
VRLSPKYRRLVAFGLVALATSEFPSPHGNGWLCTTSPSSVKDAGGLSAWLTASEEWAPLSIHDYGRARCNFPSLKKRRFLVRSASGSKTAGDSDTTCIRGSKGEAAALFNSRQTSLVSSSAADRDYFEEIKPLMNLPFVEYIGEINDAQEIGVP